MTLLPSKATVLQPTDKDIAYLLACQVNIGTRNLNNDMRHYVHGRRKDGVHVLNLGMTWEKLMLAARIIVTIENPADVCVISGRPFGMRAVLKYASYTGAQYVAGRFTPGGFTNQSQKSFVQPRLLIVTDPRVDHQSVTESSYVNVPVIAFCDTDSPLKYVDVCIPCNNRTPKSIAILYWLLAREVLRLRGQILRQEPWAIKPDLFLYRDPEASAKKEDAEGDQKGYAPDTTTTLAAPMESAGNTWGEDNWENPTNQWGDVP